MCVSRIFIRSQSQSGGGSRLTVVAVDSSQQPANCGRVDDGCVMRRGTCRKSANEVRGDIMLGATRRNDVAMVRVETRVSLCHQRVL